MSHFCVVLFCSTNFNFFLEFRFLRHIDMASRELFYLKGTWRTWLRFHRPFSLAWRYVVALFASHFSALLFIVAWPMLCALELTLTSVSVHFLVNLCVCAYHVWLVSCGRTLSHSSLIYIHVAAGRFCLWSTSRKYSAMLSKVDVHWDHAPSYSTDPTFDMGILLWIIIVSVRVSTDEQCCETVSVALWAAQEPGRLARPCQLSFRSGMCILIRIQRAAGTRECWHFQWVTPACLFLEIP